MSIFRSTLASLGGLVLAALIGAAAPSSLAAVISDNTSSATSGTESASPTRFLAATFTTDASAHTLSSVMLLMSMTSASGSAQLALYTDVGTTASPGLEPGTLIAALNSPASFTSSVGPNTFTTGGIALSANTTYWLVLKPVSGTFDWGWSAVNTGLGSGFTHVWGVSDDTGAFWWSSDFYPLQLAVTVDTCSSPSIATQPSVVNAACNATVQFSVSATGSGTLSYAWKRNTIALADNARISGATTTTLTITGTTRADPGSYTVTITNSCGATTSNAAALNVCIADYNCSGIPDVQDIFDYLNAWFTADPLTDINTSGTVDVQDIFDFLNAWFAGC
jgi:hypothetical protein